MLYKRHLKDQQRKEALKDLIGITHLDWAIGDSEDPFAIATLSEQLDLTIRPVVKGPGSVLEGINKTDSMLEHGQLTIDPSCEDLAWELENYSWKLDKNDQPVDEPVKEDDDASDMTRYAVVTVHPSRGRGEGLQILL